MLKAIYFRSMGKLEYMTKYKMDKDKKTIKSFLAIINNIGNDFFQIIISTFLDTSDNIKGPVFNNLVVFRDKMGIQHKFSFETRYVMRLDHYIEHIKRLYKTKVKKETVKLDYSQHHWYNSTIKTENEYQVNLGTILGTVKNPNSNESDNLMITVDKRNGVICRERDAFIKPISIIDGEVKFDISSIEIFTLGDTGVFHFVDKEIYHDYFDENGVHHHLVCSGLEIPRDDILHNIPTFYQNHNIITIDNEETINIIYDDYGIYKSNNNMDKYPVVYESYKGPTNISGLPDIVYSLHPVHIDHNNMNLTNSDMIYAFDNFDEGFEAKNNEYIFTREARRIKQIDIDKIHRQLLENHVCNLCVPSIDMLIYEILYG